jgi:prepilin-type N-terminal cleavage/methylation domain-containing protein
MDSSNQKKQQGFTLVEIAIVLVIIGLLLGGVLKGQELIKSAKVKAAAADVNAYSVALIGYQDRYGDLYQNGVDGKYLGGTLGTSVFGGDTEDDSALMLTELVGRSLISSKAQHALGGNIVLIKNGASGTGTLGTAILAQNTSTTPTTFSWGVCYTAISSAEDAQGLIRAIDGSDVTFPDAYRTGRARLVTNASYASGNTLNYASGTSDTICFEL